jgi:hypothetical protein
VEIKNYDVEALKNKIACLQVYRLKIW